MKDELINLRQRVAELETTLALVTAQRHPAPRYWQRYWVVTLCVGLVIVSLLLTLSNGANATVAPQGPQKVVAPFEVYNNQHQLIFAVVADPTSEGGHVLLFTSDGTPAAELLATKDGNGQIKVNRGGATRIQLGISKVGDAGNIVLSSNTTQAQTILHGDVGIRQTNAQGQPAFQAGVDDRGVGYAMAAGRSGKFLSRLTTDDNGMTGRVEVMGSDEVKVLMGVKENGKGDVCANGAPGKQVCFSGLAIKTLTPF